MRTKGVAATFLTVVCATVTWCTHADETFATLDLSRDSEVTQQIPAGDFKLEMENAIPGKTYRRSARLETIKIEKLEPLASVPKAGETQNSTAKFRVLTSKNNGCVDPGKTNAEQLLTALSEGYRLADSEEKIAIATRSFDAGLQNIDQTCRALIQSAAASAIASTKLVIANFKNIKVGQSVVVEIERISGAGEVEKKWKYVATTGTRGAWHASWAMVFVQNRNETAYAKDAGDGQYTIQASTAYGTTLVPAVFYTWAPAKFETRDLSVGFSGGVGLEGVDGPNLNLFLALSFTYNRNLSLHTGMGMVKRSTLKSNWVKGETVTEPLSNEDLTEYIYEERPFIALGMRFQ